MTASVLCAVLCLLCSPTVAFPSQETLPPPAKIWYLLSSDGLVLKWQPVEHAQGYRVRAGTKPGVSDLGVFDVRDTTFLGPFKTDGPLGPLYVTVQSYAQGSESGPSDELAVRLGYPEAGTFRLSRALRLLAENFSGFLSGFGVGSLFMLALTLGPEPFGLFTAGINPQIFSPIPQGLLIDFGDGYLGRDGHHHVGRIILSYSNVAEAGGTLTGSYSVVIDRLYVDHEFLADGALSGRFRTAPRPDFTLTADLTLSGILQDAGGPVRVWGRAHFDTALCRDYPTAGAIFAAGQEAIETILFTGSCEASFHSATWKRAGSRLSMLSGSGP